MPRPTIATMPNQTLSRLRRAFHGRGPLVALGVLALAAVAVPACAGLPRPAGLRGAVAVQPGRPAGQSGAGGVTGATDTTRALGAPAAAPPFGDLSLPSAASVPASEAAKGAAAQANSSAAQAAQAAQAQQAARAQQTAPDQQALPPLPPTGRMVIKDGTLTLEVGDLADALQRINAAVAAIPGAYVSASSTTYRATPQPLAGGSTGVADNRTQLPVPPRPIPAPGQAASITVKVPVDSFNDLQQRLHDVGKPLQENVSTQEVSEEYVDLDAQVRNLEATEQQYQQLLQRAQTIQEILPIQQRLADVRSQIDRLRGRMNLLQRRADLSTITLTLLLPSQVEGLSTAPQVVRTLQNALSGLGAILLAALDGLIYVVIYALPVVPFALAYWWWRRHRTPARAATASPTGAAM